MKSREHVQGWFDDERGDRLVELAESTPGLVVELGTAWGKSISYVLDNTDKSVVCVDLWGEGYPDAELYVGAYDSFLELLQAEGWENRVEIIRSSTQDAAVAWSRPIGLLHIDAGHDYANVLADFKMWSPFIVPGGAIAFDDYTVYRGVSQVVEEECLPDDRWIDRQVVYAQWSARLTDE